MKLILLLLTVLLTGCETTGVAINGPGYVLSYNKATGVAIHVSADTAK